MRCHIGATADDTTVRSNLETKVTYKYLTSLYFITIEVEEVHDGC